MMVQSIDAINKSILICTFLIGFLSGGAIASIVHSVIESRRRTQELEDE